MGRAIAIINVQKLMLGECSTKMKGTTTKFYAEHME
jgi:hypothetical protein